ncbi:MAG: hypothetical protein KIT35_16685 [Piscinibacter sp.]|uniref:hypothetical protein n=1 Tax=Piscinibacter sp. TaxID=1903157 RepID=UPI00258D4248|nr:hypothetical protein [Piscinibacter sp.]MCW5665471.1 hypothetical protein [Piscinibacter sp.]
MAPFVASEKQRKCHAMAQRRAEGGLRGAVERGHSAQRAWIRDGVLVSRGEFAAARGVTPEQLEVMKTEGELFTIVVDGEDWWPADLLKLSPSEAAYVCLALRMHEDAVKLLFLVRKHGALAGRTVVEAIHAGLLRRVLSLARDLRI